jgi:hypothetical protein
MRVKILHTADDNISKKKEEEIMVVWYENLDLASGACK